MGMVKYHRITVRTVITTKLITAVTVGMGRIHAVIPL